MSKILIFCFVLFTLFSCDKKKVFDSADLNNDFSEELLIIDHGPKGEVKQNQSQIRLTFNKRMRAMGEEKDVTPFFEVTPKVKCGFHWVSETTIACELKENLKVGTKYRVFFKKGIKSKEGQVSRKDYSFEFTSGAPKILKEAFFEEKKLPYVYLYADNKFDLSKLKRSLKCSKGEYPAHIVYDENESSHFIRYSESIHSIRYKVFIKPSEVKFPLENCTYEIEGTLASSEGTLEREYKLSLSTKVPVTGNEDKDSLLRSLHGITCQGGYWRRESLVSPKLCSTGKPIRFQFKDRISEDTPIEVIPPVKNFEAELKYSTFSLYGDFESGKVYDIRFGAGYGLDKDVIASVEVTNNVPEASLRYKNVVIEKTGPHQVPLQVKNIDSFDVQYIYSNDVREVARAALLNNGYGVKLPLEIAGAPSKELLMPNPSLDMSMITPIEIDTFGSGAGTYWLNLKSKKIKEQARIAHKKFYDFKKYRRDYVPYEKNLKLITQVTNLGMHVKRGYLNTLVWVYDIPSGTPVSGVSVHAFSKSENENLMVKTDSDGLAVFNVKNHSRGNQLRVFVAKKEDDVSFVSEHSSFSRGISPWSFNVSYSDINDSKNFLVETIPDRPIYKAGDQVSLKFYVRKWDLLNLRYVSPESKRVHVVVRDSRSNEVQNTKVNLNEFSTGSTSFKLDKDAKLGEYTVTLKPEGADHHLYTQGFMVQEYKLSPFKIEVEHNKKQYLMKESVSVEGRASYFFGGAYKNAPGTIVTTFKKKLYRPKNEKYQRFRFHDSNNYSYYHYYFGGTNTYAEELQRNSFTTDKNGSFYTAVYTSGINPSSLAGTISTQVVIEGESGQKIAKTVSSEYLNSSYVIGSRFPQWSYKDGLEIGPDVVVLDQNENIKTGLKLEYELFKKEWDTVRRLGTGNYYYYDSAVKDKSLGKCSFNSNDRFDACKIKVDGNGSYYSVVRGKDSRGNKIKVKSHTYVNGGGGYASWNHYNHDRIDLLPDKYNYKIGDVAKILIKSPFKEAKVLVTVERYGILKSEVIKIIGNTHVYELPIKESAYAPGVYVSAVLLKGRTEGKVEGLVDLGKPAFKMGYVKIGVKDKDLLLDVVAKANPKRLKPKEKVNVEIDVKDLKGDSDDFEVAVAVVDEAVLQLVGSFKQRYKLFDTFYKMPDIAVVNYQTLVSLLGRQTYGNKGGTPGGGGGFDEEVREDFMAVAHWEPHLRTKNGKVKISFEVPDNLTTWKILAIANDKTRKFGLGVGDFMVTKDIITEPVLPTFLTEGDKFDAKLVVHNKTNANQKVKVSIKAKGFSPDNAKEELDIKEEDKGKVGFRITAPKEGEYELILSAKSESDSDVVKYLMPVIPLQTLFVDGLFGHTVTSKIEVPFSLPRDIKNGSQEIDMKVSSTVLAGLRSSFEYVLRYPYGCWEQRMTKALYLAFYEKLKPIVGVIGDGFPEGKQRIQELLDMAPKYMGRNGGMKYYPSEYNKESPYLSTFTGLAFHFLEDMGYRIPSESKMGLKKYLLNSINDDFDWGDWYKTHTITANKAMIVDVLDRWGEKGLEGTISTLVNDYDSLPLFGKSFLLSTMSRKSKYEDKAKSLMNNLVSNMDLNAAKAQFPANESYFNPYFLDTNNRAQCAMMNTLLELDSSNEVVSKLQNYISSTRKMGRWYNTQENLFCLYAMYNYSRIYENEKPEFTAITTFNKSRVNVSDLNLDKNTTAFAVDITSVKPGADSKIEIEKKGKGRMYYFAWLKYSKDKLPTKRVSQGFGLEKEMYRFDEEKNSWEKLSQSMKLKLGDIVRVRLKIDTKGNRTHVGLEDPLAGCFTPINTALATTATGSKAFTTPIDNSGMYTRPGEYTWNSAFRHIEYRKTAVQFYAPTMVSGTYGVEYDMRVTGTGNFMQNAPSVEEMYYPDIRGTGLGRSIEVTE